MLVNSPFTTIHTAIIRRSRPMVLYKKVALTSFAKFTREWSYRLKLNFIKKEIPAWMFSCEFCEIYHNTFFKELFGRLLLHKRSFRLLSHRELLTFQKRCDTYFPTEYFLGLICRLGKWVSSMFQILSQKPIFNPVEHLLWSFFAKIINNSKLARF